MSRLLLDTHTVLWCLSDVEQLAEDTRATIVNPHNDVFVSAITGWEIAVKQAKGRLVAPDNLPVLIEQRGFTHLPLTFHHAEQAGSLPLHHRDPFDRFLIAQAQAEGLILVTRDGLIRRYDVAIMKV